MFMSQDLCVYPVVLSNFRCSTSYYLLHAFDTEDDVSIRIKRTINAHEKHQLHVVKNIERIANGSQLISILSTSSITIKASAKVLTKR